jgi:outer membrane protein OmpA-like peptidoglycan-associated protein
LGEKGATSSNKAENRKAIIHFLQEKDLAKENEILGIKDTIEILIPENATLEEKVKLSKVGAKIVLKNINFYQNTFATVPESQGAMYDLLYVMQNNPNLKIEIQGHICCQMGTDMEDTAKVRALAVYNYLINNGVNKNRLSYKSFGSSKPIHIIPENNEDERNENRRVEIQIVAN